MGFSFTAPRRVAVILLALLWLALGASPLVAGPASAGAPNYPAPAYVVDLARTGGLTGGSLLVSVGVRTPGHADLFAVVNSAEFRALDASYLPDNPCCDRYTYDLTIGYADHTVKKVTTMDGVDAPEVLWKAIRLALVMGQG